MKMATKLKLPNTSTSAIEYSLDERMVIVNLQTAVCPSIYTTTVTDMIIYSKNTKYITRNCGGKICDCTRNYAVFEINGFGICEYLCGTCCYHRRRNLDITRISDEKYTSLTSIESHFHRLSIDFDKNILTVLKNIQYKIFVSTVYKYDHYREPARPCNICYHNICECWFRSISFWHRLMAQNILILREIINVNDIIFTISLLVFDLLNCKK